MIHKERIHKSGRSNHNAHYIIYWMQQSQRISYNHALQYAIRLSNDKKIPLIVYFLILPFPEANLRHYQFMTDNVLKLKDQFRQMNINMIIDTKEDFSNLIKLSQNAFELVTDKGYLRIQKQWKHHVKANCPCYYSEIESDVVIPVETLSHKEEYSAFTLRKKAVKLLDYFLKPLIPQDYEGSCFNDLPIDPPVEINNQTELLNNIKADLSIRPSDFFTGGEFEAHKYLNHFLESKLDQYAEKRNDPALDYTSNLSPYLHFGQLSPLETALESIKKNKAGSVAFLEKLIIRRELAVNFVHYNPNYDQYKALPSWSRQTLNDHINNSRPYLYSPDEFENAQTHDIYWNSAQNEMRITGKMHGYMRMYWGKKIIEWSETPEDAFNTALYLNNKYELDGRDPNAFAGVAWCFGKHDRPWTSRNIFGTVRYMNAAGLKRKFDIDAYVIKIQNLANPK